MDNCKIANEAFQYIINANPNLEMVIVVEPDDYDAEMNIPAQEGLDFSVHLNLQNTDELHLVVEPFWGEWFPCTEPDRVKEYIAAVNGVLNGSSRIKIISRNGNPVKAILQEPDKEKWQTSFTWSKLHLPLGKISTRYVQNQ
jgi:hypothetical protein